MVNAYYSYYQNVDAEGPRKAETAFKRYVCSFLFDGDVKENAGRSRAGFGSIGRRPGKQSGRVSTAAAARASESVGSG